MLIGSQAFRESPGRHAPAVILGVVPHLAHWAEGFVRSSLTVAGVKEITHEITGRLATEGVLLHGLSVLGNGGVLSGIVLAASTVFIIERQLWRATAFMAVGSVLTYFGFMHSERIGIGQSLEVAAAYVIGAVFLAGCAKFSGVVPREPATVAPHD
jgi:AGZA family xanthine/uracil permease-like MFS transporter